MSTWSRPRHITKILLCAALLLPLALWSQCPGSVAWNGSTPATGTLSATGTILSTVTVTVTQTGSFASGRPGYANNNNSYNGYNWRSLMTYRGASFATGTNTRFDLSVPVSPAYIHLRVADIRGDGFNTEHQRVQAFLNGNPVAVTFEDPVNGAFVSGGNIINGASTTNSTTQSSMRAFFSGPVDRIVVTATGLSDYVIIDLFARCDILLPYQLTSFDALATHNLVDLSWTVEAESQVQHYVLERSEDGRQWTERATLPALGGSGTARTYRYRDTVPQPGRYVYRLRSLEAGGGMQYSRSLPVHVAPWTAAGLLVIYPNPAHASLSFRSDVRNRSPLRIRIYTMDGRLQDAFELRSGDITRPTSHWARGIYTVEISDAQGPREVRKVLIQ